MPNVRNPVMPLAIKICGVKTHEAMTAAAQGGAAFLGFNFYEPSPRYVSPQAAGHLAKHGPASIKKVALFVDADDVYLEHTLKYFPADMLQLHGHETPQRVQAIKETFHLPVIKALAIAEKTDLAAVENYRMADMLMFDAKPPKDAALPGGNAVSFDWSLLHGVTVPRPWFLAGGINKDNMREAVKQSGARFVDIASGAEIIRGEKDPTLIKAILEQAQGL